MRRAGEAQGRRRRLESDDPKYGSKGRFLVSPRTLTTVMVFVVGLCVCYLVVVGSVRKYNSAQSKYGQDDPKLFEGKSFNVRGTESLTAGERREQSGKEAGEPQYSKLVDHLDDGSLIGYVRVPKIPKGERTGDDGRVHIIFSSGCNYFQHWQSEMLLASAYLVGQRGRITRIVSGCNDKRAENVQHKQQTFPSGKNDLLVPLDILNRSVNDNFGLFITPAFDGAIDFPWINKPNSIKYFMDHARSELDRVGETTIVILDPDFIFLKPLTQTGLKPGEYIASRGHESDPGRNDPIDVVKKGRPVAQRYGLEGGWVSSRYDLAKITGDPNNKAQRWTSSEAARWTSVGPPLMLHVDDLANLSTLWAQYMRPVLDVEVDILADMWAYSIAAAQLDLKHTILDQYMISSWGSHGEGFEWVDEWRQMSCLNPKATDPAFRSPTFIHMASNFKAPNPKSGPWMFHKGHVPATILDCDTPLIKESPDDLFDITSGKEERQRAWVLCHIVSRLNKVLLMYKQKFCPVGFEQRKLIRLIQSKTTDKSCSERRDKWCFPLAQIEDLPNNWREMIV